MANNTIDMKKEDPVEALAIVTGSGTVTNDVALVYKDSLSKQELVLSLRKLEQKIINDHLQG